MAQDFTIEGSKLIFSLQEEMYTKEILFHAAYVLLEDFYFFFDKKQGYFEICLTPKKTLSEDELKGKGYEFLDELVESRAYIEQLQRTSGVREILLQRALLSQSGEEVDFETLKKELENSK